MDFIRALQQAAPAASSVGDTVVPSSTDISEVSVRQPQGGLAASGEENSTSLDANEVSGGLSHFLEAEHFLSRTMQLVCSTLELCGRVRAKDAIHTVRAPKKVLIPQHRNSVREEESTGEKRGDLAKLISPTRKESNRVSDEIDKLCIPESIYRTYTCIKDSVSAVAFCVATLEIYQSQPMLLDPHLLDIVKPLSHTVASNLDLVTPLLVSELRAKLSAIFFQLSRALSSNSPVHPETSLGSISSSSPSVFPTHLSLPASICSASASSPATSSSAALCGPSHYYPLSLERNCSSVANPKQSSLFASLPLADDSKPADTCMRTTNSSSATTSEPHCFSGNSKQLSVQQLEDLYLRTAASLALRLLMHLLYVVSRVRGYKHLRQLLPSEPELLEVVVDHCEQLLDAEFLQPLRAAPPTKPCSTIVADTLPVVAVTEAPASHEGLHQSNGLHDDLNFAATRDTVAEGECAGNPDRENVFSRCPEPLLVQQTQHLLELLQQLPLWSTHYYLLVWLSLLVLAPFDLETLDSSGSAASHTQQPAAGTVLPSSRGQLEEETRERMPAGEELTQQEVLEKIKEIDIVRYHQQPLGLRIIALVEGYLRRTSSKASDAAALVVARFFSRPDVGTKAAGTLSAFLQFCQDVLDGGRSSAEGSAALSHFRCRVSASGLENTADSTPLFAKANALQAVNEILKNIPRESALPELPRLLHLLDIRPSTSLAAAGPVESAGSQQQKITGEEKQTGNAAAVTHLENAARSALFRKLRCSCAARICMLLLPPVGSEVYQWRYIAHARNLEAHLKQSQQQMLQQQTAQQQGTPADDRESTMDSVSKAVEHHNSQHEVHEEDVPEAVEEMIDLLLESLADRDTVVRWAAAKAIGRTVLQLRQSFASQVVGSILEKLEINAPYRAASAERLWHGSCLALGELLRRGLVNPEEHLHACATRLCFALSLDTSKSVGWAHGSGYMTSATATAEQLRDAACFAVWSLARAYYHHTEPVKQQVGRLSEALLLVALFDREVNCRRAAAAAFQELEGRQGGIPHGLQIVTTADFFALATRRSAYLKVAPQVAALDNFYRILLLDTLMKLLLQQSDEEMRTLAAAAIKRIATLRERSAVQQYMEFLLERAIGERENLTTRHGALLGLTALLESLENSVGKKSSGTTAAPVRETALREERRAPETAVAPTSDTCSTSVRNNNNKVEDWNKEENSSLLEDKLQTCLRQLVITIEKQRLYRGKGGDMIRTAVCRFIQALTTSEYILFKRATARRYIATLMEGLRHFSDCVQLAAAEALRALLRLRLSREEVLQEVVPELLQRLQNPSENVAARRGYALALATLPEDVYRTICSSPFQQQDNNSVEPSNFLEFLQTEAVSFAPLGRPSLGDAQTRRNALIALAFALRALLTSPLWTAAAKRKHEERGILPGAGDGDAALEGRLESAEIQSLPARNAEIVKGEESKAVRQTCPGETVKTPVATGAAPSSGPATEGGNCAAAAAARQKTRPSALSSCEVKAGPSLQPARKEDLERGKATVDAYEMTEECISGHVFKTSSRILESICNTLESCSVDYQVDRRGDVGSWVREVAAEVATFLLENPHIACYRSCSCICTGQTGSEQAVLAHNKDSDVTDVRIGGSEDQNCAKARLFSLLLRLSLENLDRTRSRAVFLLYHLVAPLPASCFHTHSAKTFKVEWIWSRVFYDFSYEAVSANLIPRPDLLRADPSPCLAMPSQGRTGTQQEPWDATRKTTGAAELTSARASAVVTMTRCALLVAMLQHVLVPLAEEQTNALESVTPQMPFHNLNLSEFAAINASSRWPSAGGSRGKRGGGAGIATGAQIDEAIPRRSAADGGEDTATATFEAVSSLGHESDTKCTVIETVQETERLAKEWQDVKEVENTEQVDSTFVNNKSSFDFLLELSVGDGGRASLHKTRKAGVLLRLPLFTDPAMTYPQLLLSLLMPPPFSYAAAQGLCLGVGALAGSTSDRAAQALLRFLTNLRHAGDARGDGAATTLDKQAALVDLQQSEITQERRARSTRLFSSAAGTRTEQQEAAVDLLSEFRSGRLLWKGEAVVREVGSLLVNVLEDSANELTRNACKREAGSDLHSEKMCLAALKTVALISGFLSKDEISRVMELLLKTLDDGVWRRIYQYAKARCEAFIALLAAGWIATPSGCLCNDTTKETVDTAAAETQNSCKTYKKALCAVLQYLTHSFPKLRQLAAEELYASLLLPLSATHGQWSHCETARHTDSTAPTEKMGTFARGCQKSAISPQFVQTARQIEDASQVVIKTPWMEICTNHTEPVERLVDLFDLRVEWDEIVDKKGRE